MKMDKKALSALLLVLILVFGTLIANRLPGQLDLTAGKAFTLSRGSESILSGLEEPVTLNFYFSRSLEGLPIRLKNYATRVEDLLRQYRAAADGMVRLRVIDPRPDTEEESAALRAGMSAQPVGGSNLFFGLEAVQADSTAVVPFFTFDRESLLEYDISQLIFEVQQLEKPVIGLLGSLPVEGSPPDPMNPMARQPADRWVFLDSLEQRYTVRSLNTATGQLPDDLDLLIVLHPQDLEAERLYQIDQYVLSGRPLLALVDPSSYWQRTNSPGAGMMGMQGPDTSSSLDRLFGAYGIEVTTDRVVADPALASPVSTGRGMPAVPYPVWMSLRGGDPDNPVTANLEQLLFAEAGAVRLAEDTELEMTPLVWTSEEAGLLDARTAAMVPPQSLVRSLGEERSREVLAAVMEGPLETAFPEGPPADGEEAVESGDEASAEDADTVGHLAETGPGGARLVVVGDTDFLADMFSVQVMSLLGMRSATPINDNLSFFFNAVDTLTGSPDLVSLRGKGRLTRPFTVVERMQREAQEEYQEQLEQLESRLAEVRQELSQLRQPAGGELIVSDETREAIERFQLEEAEVRSQQREIRKKLREDVEALELRLAVINLLAVPLVIAIAGVITFARRR